MSADKSIVRFTYRNHKGETALRTVRPIRLWFGSTAYHPEAQWLLEAFDLDRLQTRDFAMEQVEAWGNRGTSLRCPAAGQILAQARALVVAKKRGPETDEERAAAARMSVEEYDGLYDNGCSVCRDPDCGDPCGQH